MQMVRKWTKEACIEEAKKFKTRGEWCEKSHTSYQRACDREWLEECAAHMPPPRTKPTLERCKEDALKYQSKSEWAKMSGYLYHYALRKEWISECCGHMTRPKRIKKDKDNVVSLFGKVTEVQEKDLNTMLAGLQEAKVVLMAATEGCCLVSVNEAIEVIERLKRSKAV